MPSEHDTASPLYRILIVEDEPTVARVIELTLESPRTMILRAGSVMEAQALLRDHAFGFDVVITDNQMPNLSGLELVRYLHAHQFPGRIIVLSAYVSPEDKITYRELGAHHIIAKPFNMPDLRHAVGLREE